MPQTTQTHSRPSRSARRGAAVVALALLFGACGAADDAQVDADGADGAPIEDVMPTDGSASDVDATATTDTDIGVDTDTSTVAPPVPPDWSRYAPPAPPVPRLTSDQLRAAWLDLLGDDIVIPPVNMPDVDDGGFTAVGAGAATVSPRTVEDLERAALELANQALSEQRRERFVNCEPEGVRDDACAESTLATLGRRAWRRPLTTDELAPMVALAGQAAEEFEDFYLGLTWPVAAMLQSPHLMFRRELGVVGEDGVRRFTDWEMASRLSFLLWNTIPDEWLLDAAERGELTDDETLATIVAEMLADPRAQNGLLEFFRQAYTLHKLRRLTKDPTVFADMSPELGPAALRETELFLLDIAFGDVPYHDLLLSERTYVDRRLAALYGVPAPTRDGFGETSLPIEMGRRGFLGQASFLLVNSHPTSTSATLRGQFVRERLLCQAIPAPPADVDTSIPEPDADSPTLRQRLRVHLEDDSCAGCHSLTDPIGLAFENFDGIGTWRGVENGATIDASGDLDGQPFDDAWGLAEAIAERDEFVACLVRQWTRYATGTIERREQDAGNYALAVAFAENDYRFISLVEAFVMSPAFRTVSSPPTEAP